MFRRGGPNSSVCCGGARLLLECCHAAAPAEGFGRLEKWAASDDKDVRWIVRENLKKARLARADPAAAG